MKKKPFGSAWLLSAAAVAAAALWMQGSHAVDARPKSKPGKAPTTQVVVPQNREVATIAAGCFWSMEAIFKQLKGIDKVVPGYAGGHIANPTYEQVEEGNTGYAEALQITYDPKVISYADLLQVLLIARNPTTLNQQGPDEGPQYRSVIFAHNAQQAKIARETIAKVSAAHTWNAPIVTPVTGFTNFYKAEDYHFDYYNLHPNQPYCSGVIAPEIAEFRAKFKDKLK